MDIAIYTITSPLHNATALQVETQQFLDSLNIHFQMKGDDFSDYGSHALNLIYIRTGGTEGLFQELLHVLLAQSERPIYLLASDKSNSLAASMEILSYLHQNNIKGEIVHGNATYLSHQINLLYSIEKAYKQLQGCRLGIIGKPSDWLISSGADKSTLHQLLGIELIDIQMSELVDAINSAPKQNDKELLGKAPTDAIRKSIPGAMQIYAGLKQIVADYRLQGFTIRCFDLLPIVHNTGCLALATLNAEGIVAGCEGDIPALLSMMIAHSLFNISGFQANPVRINPETGELIFAHCTIPFNMVGHYEFDTHFESGIGIGIRGYMPEGEVTIFKVAGNLSRYFAEEGRLVHNQSEPHLCRTQQVIQLSDKSKASYFLTSPIGNHHIILPGHCKELLETFLNETQSSRMEF
jgi:L-fucose isomerase-like protein